MPPLLTVDGPVDQLTRRRFLVATAATGLLAAGCGGTESAGEPGTRLVRHAGGTTEVPVRPERVATLGEALTGHLASVGLLPVAAPEDMLAWLEPYRELLPDGDLGAIQSIGTAEEPNLEVLARIAPELILLEREVPAAAAQIMVTFLQGRGAGSFRVDGPGAFGGSVAAEAGFGVDEGGAGGEPSPFGYVEFSPERLGVADGDLLVVPTRPGGPSGIEELEANPLWGRLPAVQTGSVLRLPNSVYNGGTYVAAELLVRALTDDHRGARAGGVARLPGARRDLRDGRHAGRGAVLVR